MPNHLAGETSPYLLQHVNNPVDWYPWGEEALALSRKLDRPIFLSIGYSACHWCHVMEHESFEDSEIAKVMNESFVCIKVDREERPDLDQIYMNAVQAMTGSGGWPMSVFLTPDQKPFYGGTYWPPTARWGRPGFREILLGVHEAWKKRRQAVHEQAEELTSHVRTMSSSIGESKVALSESTLRRAMHLIVRSADREHGGFGSAPKFPHPMDLRFAMRAWKRFQSQPDSTNLAQDALDVVTLTLDKMSRGGIYDHLGGGFARYSTDQRWLVPHFEKMLYDNAQLVPAYLEAFQITGRADYARVARETLDYVLREMTQPEGAFYSTQDADSESVEGKFFVWQESEIDQILSEVDWPVANPAAEQGKSPLELFKSYYQVTRQGNWEHANILNCAKSREQTAKEWGLDAGELDQVLERCRSKLFEVRSQRVWPGRDDKVLVSWNGLMIGALAMSASVLEEPRYADAARAAADFILDRMVKRENGAIARLYHGYKDGRARFNGYLDDYAALIDGLCELYQAVFDTRYLDAALELTERMVEQFRDEEAGGFYYTSANHETLIARSRETYDNATPSGNSLAAAGLLKLSRLTGRMDLEQIAVTTLEMMSAQLDRSPLASGLALMALDFLMGPAWEIVIAEESSEPSESMVRFHRRYVPNKVIQKRPSGLTDDQLPDCVRQTLSGKTSRSGLSTVYICQRGICQAPITDATELEAALERI